MGWDVKGYILIYLYFYKPFASALDPKFVQQSKASVLILFAGKVSCWIDVEYWMGRNLGEEGQFWCLASLHLTMGDQSVCLPCTPHSIRQTWVCVATPFWGQSAVGWNLKVNILAKGWSPVVWQNLEVSMWTKMLRTGWVWSCLVVGAIREKIIGCII